LAVPATGSATRASYHRLTADVAALRGEVTDLRQAQEASSRDVTRTTAETRTLEARLGEVSAAQTNAANEVATLRGRLHTAEGEPPEGRRRAYRQGMTECQKVLDVAPNSPKVPDALLKVGLCYRNLRAESRARQTWDRVAKDYPKSASATKARALLNEKASAATK